MMNNIFGKRLKLLRTEMDIKAEDLAKDLNTTQATISRYENGLRTPDIEFLKIAADYFKVPADYLLGKTNIREPGLQYYPKTNNAIAEVRGEVAKYGYDITDKTNEEIAKMIVKYLKLDEINKM